MGTKTEVVVQSITPISQECDGLLYVATNRPIPIGIQGTKIITNKNVGGYYLIHKEDWKTISRIVKEYLRNHKIKSK